MSWEREDSERWLSDNPLPRSFSFNGEVTWPKYKLKKGYGQWLRTAGSYHPALRGLFALCHEILAGLPVGRPMPGGTELAELIDAESLKQGALSIPTETQEKPSDNPTSNPGDSPALSTPVLPDSHS